jgi:hypothetical protein
MVIPLSERESPERRKDEVFVYDEDLHSYGARDPYRGSVKKELREKEKEEDSASDRDLTITPLTQPYEGVPRSDDSVSEVMDAVTPLAGPYAGVSRPPQEFQIGGMMPRPPRYSIQPGATESSPSRIVMAASSDEDAVSDASEVEMLSEIHSKLHEANELQLANHRLLTKAFQQPHHTFLEEVFHDSVVVLRWMKFLYRALGSFPVLGPWLQCVFLLNTFCAMVMIIPTSVRETVIIPLLSLVGLFLKIFFYPLGYYSHRILLSPHMHEVGSFFKSLATDAVSEALYLVGKGAMTLTGSDYVLNVMRDIGVTAPVAVEPRTFDFLETYLPHGVVETARSMCPGC